MLNREKKRSIRKVKWYIEGKKDLKAKCEHRIYESESVGHHATIQPVIADNWYSLGEMKLGRLICPCQKVKVNLPKLKLPVLLLQEDEKAMIDLSLLLRDHGFEVIDRPTLAFFAIGKQHDVVTAANCFKEFYKLANTIEFRFPDLYRMEQMAADGLVEGFGRQPDGTAGIMVSAGNWNVENYLGIYVAREMLCHIVYMVDFPLLKKGLTDIANMQELAWRNFAPFELANVASYLTKCNPIFFKKLFLLQPNYYASVALKVILQMFPSHLRNVAEVLSLSEVREKFPNILLPPSLTPSTNENVNFTRLSLEEQLNFRFLFDF